MARGIGGQKRFRGTLLGAEGDAVRIRRDDAATGEQQEFVLPIEDMAEAKLMLTDALIAQALKRSKAAEREAKQAQKSHRHSKQFRRTREDKRDAQHEGD